MVQRVDGFGRRRSYWRWSLPTVLISMSLVFAVVMELGALVKSFQVQVCKNPQLWMPSSVWWLKSLCLTWQCPPWVIRPTLLRFSVTLDHPRFLSAPLPRSFIYVKVHVFASFLLSTLSLDWIVYPFGFFFISYLWSLETFLLVIYNCLTSQAQYTMHDIAFPFPGY